MNDSFVKNRYLDFYLFAGYDNDFVHQVYKSNGGSFDPAIAEWIVNNVKEGWIVYDVGANMFEFTEMCARLSGKNGKVYSFEPQKHLIDKYNEAKSLNSYDDVADIFIYDVGLGSINEDKEFRVNPNNFGGSSFSKEFTNPANHAVNWEIHNLSVVRADSLNLPDTIPDLIKVDIEGYEEEFWNGCPNFIKNAKNIIMEVGPYTTESFLKDVMSGRTAYDIHENRYLHIDEIITDMQKDILFQNIT
jgi:FkbM family methyltransferase